MTLAAVSSLLYAEAKENLSRRGFSVVEITPDADVDPRISDHPDIHIFSASKSIFVHQHFSPETEQIISRKNSVVRCSTPLTPDYPGDCAFNIAFTGKYALYKRGIIPVEIESFFDRQGIIRVYVPQGYARCSTVVLSKDVIATEDSGIASAAEKAELEVIGLTPGLIPLEGFPRGFAGGAFSFFNNTLYATGKIPEEESYRKLRMYCAQLGIAVCELSDREARDFGSIIFC